jgi:hypothetical protein
MAQQIRPEALRVAGADEARRIEAAAAGTPRLAECLQAGPFDAAVAEPLRQVLAAWPPGSWSLEAATEPARWIVYMGKYPSLENVSRKRAELRQLGISFEPLSNATLEPGLSLGGYSSQGAAEAQLERLAERGVRTARVLQERPELRGSLLKLPAVDDGLRPRLEEIRPALGAVALRACR